MLAWDRQPIMSDQELENLMERPPDRVITEEERRQFNCAFLVTSACTVLFSIAIWISVAWFFVYAATEGWRHMNAVTGWIIKALGF